MLNTIYNVLNKYNIDRTGLSTVKQRYPIFGPVMFLPAVFFLIIFAVIPVIYILYLSFFEISLTANVGDRVFVGLENYAQIITSPDVHHALWVGIRFAVGTVLIQVLIGLLLALVLNQEFIGSSYARTFALLPYLVPGIAVVLMFRWIADPTYGIGNALLISSGFVEEPISFFGSIELALPAVIVASSWKYISFCILVFLARLQSIDDILYEQAKISGASELQMFRTITLPNLRSAILLVILLRMIWMFNKFGIIWQFTSGGPLDATTTLPIHIYEVAFEEFDLGLSSAASMVLFFLLTISAIIYFWRFKPSKEIET